MRPPPIPHASPLPSFATRPHVAPRPVSFAELLRAIIAWWKGRPPTLRKRQIEQQRVDRLAEELAEEQVVEATDVNRPRRRKRSK